MSWSKSLRGGPAPGLHAETGKVTAGGSDTSTYPLEVISGGDRSPDDQAGPLFGFMEPSAAPELSKMIDLFGQTHLTQ